MPLIIATLVVAVVLGLWAPRRVAIGGTLAAAGATLFGFVWAVADGQGHDPWWIVLLAGAGGALALAVTATLLRVRDPARTAEPRAATGRTATVTCSREAPVPPGRRSVRLGVEERPGSAGTPAS